MATTTTIHDWQSLVELSGLLISEPVLNDQFSDGPQPLPSWLARKFRKEYERWQATEDKRSQNSDKADDARRRWQRFVLTDLLEYGERVGSILDMLPHLKVELTDYMQTLKPDMFIVDEQANPQVLVYVAEKGLDRPERKTGQWKASPFTKIDRLLRETKVQLGILTNGEDWRLVYAAPGLPTSYITWTAAGWKDETLTLQAFQMLLRDPARLLEMASESQSRQADVTDKLGNQVLSALSIFVRQLDRADTNNNGELLADLSSQAVYEMALFVMMRLVFIFYAEENTLLPHGDPIFDDAYGLTRLWNNLDRERFEDETLLQQREDAWPGLLATFRLIHAGCAHPDLNMVAYGGALFDSERFSVLEDSRLRITNEAIWKILRRLTTAEADGMRQRVSYRSLQVEQLGYVYENLLGYTVKEATEDMVLPVESLQAVTVQSYIEALGAGDEKGFYEYFKGLTTEHWSFAKKIAGNVAERYATGSDDVAWVFENAIDEPISPGQRFVAYEMGTRKRGGIFYTPPQLTSFLVEQALKPQVYTDPDNEAGIRSAEHILSLTVCDPAMGSGAFLVQAVRYLADRLLEAWDAQQTAHDDTALVMPHAQPEASASENYGIIPTDRAEALAWARRLVAERCIYGVDLNHLAVELAKLSIWLVTLSKDKPFTFLDHRLRHGNSLIGASFFKETTVEWTTKSKDPITGERIKRQEQVRQMEFIPDEALKAYKDADKDYKKDTRDRLKINQKAQLAIAQGQMGLFGELSVEQALAHLIQQKADLEQPTQRADEYEGKAQLLRDVLGQGDYPKLKEITDLWCAVWFWDRDIAHAGMPPNTEEYQDTVLAILGKLQRDLFGDARTKSQRIDQIRNITYEVAQRETFFHWELEFPQVFTRDNAGFDAMVGNPPWEIVKLNSQEFFETYDPNFRNYGKQEANSMVENLITENTQIADAWETYSTSLESQATFYKSDIAYKYQGTGDVNTYKLFVELTESNCREDGYFSLIIPSGIYTDLGAKDLRNLLLFESQLVSLYSFENRKKIFPIHSSFKFVLLTAQIGAETQVFHAKFSIQRIEELNQVMEEALVIRPQSIRDFSPESLSIMEFISQNDVSATEKIYQQYPLLGEHIDNTWNIRFSREFHMTDDSFLFNGNEIPLYEGKMIWHYDCFYSEPRYWINKAEAIEALSAHKKTNFLDYRLGFRDVASATNERTVVSAIIPKEHFAGNTVILSEGEYFKRDLLFFTTIFNSLTLDFIIRQKVTSHVNIFYVEQLPVPRLQAGNLYFDALVPRAARLTCTTHHFAELWEEVMGSAWDESVGATSDDERQGLRDEIDAIVAHLYGLSRDDFAHILGTFPLVFKDTEEGQAKKARLLDEYDVWADVVKDWSRE